MKPLTIVLSDSVYASASEEAKDHDVDVANLCSGVLSDYFLDEERGAPPATAPSEGKGEAATAFVARFDVAAAFQGFPRLSIDLAQRFTDEAMKLGHVRAFKNRRGIGFEPNFVFIEYLMSRSRSGGIGVSFYGGPDRHSNPPPILRKGIPSYSRAKIYSHSDLDAILPHVRQSFELKFGKG